MLQALDFIFIYFNSENIRVANSLVKKIYITMEKVIFY
jgi:hypothetical protein